MTGISIFIDSITTSVSPESTLSPGFDFTCQTVPVISDLTSIRAMDAPRDMRWTRARETCGPEASKYSIGIAAHFRGRVARHLEIV